MRNPLQEQLLKAGLVNKVKAAQVVREQAKKHKGKGSAVQSSTQSEAQRSQLAKIERDRALAAERNARNQTNEARAQARQIIEAHKLPREGDLVYRFSDGDRIKDLLVNDALRAQLAAGTSVIVRHGEGYELLPRAAADKVHERDCTMIVLDHGNSQSSVSSDADDDYYKQFQVPDDLIW